MIPASLPFARTAAAPARADGVRVATGLIALVILCAAVAIRLGEFGDPIAGLDEQFYLLLGDRIWSGQLPFTEIWDRKPAGLFYLYALIRLLPGDGILAYQLVGTAFLAATGAAVAAIGRHALPAYANLTAGLAVVVYGTILGSGFGEAPIFYDLLVVAAGWLVIDAVERPRDDRAIDRRACAAMLLCGLALTIKTSAIFESVAFGLLILAADRRRTALHLADRARAAALYVALGVVPFALTALPYLFHGGLDMFVFANFRSAFLRSGGMGWDSVGRAGSLLALLAPLIVPGLMAIRRVAPGRRGVLIAWTVAGFLSFVSLGRCYEHYALPLVAPLALLAAYGFARPLILIPVATLLTIAASLYATGIPAVAKRDKADIASLAAALPSSVRTGCLFVFEGPTILYHLAHACLPGRYVFPGHFTEATEEGALEKPMVRILTDTLARRPAVIVMIPAQDGPRPAGNRELLMQTLADSYRPVARRGIRLYGAKRVDALVWVRR